MSNKNTENGYIRCFLSIFVFNFIVKNFLFITFKSIYPKRGKIAVTKRLNFILSSCAVKDNRSAYKCMFGLAIKPSKSAPINCGPIAPPESPPAAIIAKATTPMFWLFSSSKIREPGQSIEEKIPVSMQPKRLKNGQGEMAQIE